jgi:hypothetical protein
MKVSVKNYLLYSSVFAIFSESFFFHFIIDLKLFYVIIFVNFYILSTLKKITVNKYVFITFIGLLIHGLVANTLIGVSYKYLIAQLIGIFIVSTYYYNFVSYIKVNKLIDFYSKTSLFVAALGFPMLFLGINCNDGFRLQSVFNEPAHFAIVVIPACYLYLKQKKYYSFSVLFVSLLMSQSSLGYIGCMLMFLLPNLTQKRVLYLLAIVPFAFAISYWVYIENINVKIRIDDTLKSYGALANGKFEETTNLSSYALMSNVYITKKNIQNHPFGSGLGSHTYMHKNVYLNQMNPPAYIKTLKLDDINSSDANSLFLRLFSDLGIFGLFIVILLIYYGFKSFGENNYLIISQGIFIYILLKLIRDGHYFPPELYFFIWLMYFNYKENITKSNFGKIL